ncbi:hypothetical protein ZOSMA_71G00160 [Zostera marina]|uniref:Uncharacterized protein n=1 Tax=Zostera marina TaxID=29655 RepID=A0A0K9NS84_ZOSMR|nr:hypothetical protein ZOSMA_71G00160 [Zostera marina]
MRRFGQRLHHRCLLRPSVSPPHTLRLTSAFVRLASAHSSSRLRVHVSHSPLPQSSFVHVYNLRSIIQSVVGHPVGHFPHISPVTPLSTRDVGEARCRSSWLDHNPTGIGSLLCHEIALELKARSLLFLRKFKQVVDMLRDYIPSFKSIVSSNFFPDYLKILPIYIRI